MKKTLKLKSLIFLILVLSLSSIAQNVKFIPNKVVPSQKQLDYQKMEFVGFIHFNMNTFTDKEWGFGDESPTLFNPLKLDVEQWVKAAQAGGMKELILTAKHHDGFCLWPSAFTEHSLKNSPYKNGKGDIVKEFTNACHKYGMKVGLYLSPWDRNHAGYGTPEYITYYKNQLKELLTNYGEITEMWFDGANGGDGYYGGAREKRIIDKTNYYPWAEIRKIVYSLQPNASIFSDAGPDIHWIGNERGIAGETFWSTIDTEKIIIGDCDKFYLNSGDYQGKNWSVGQCDVSIRKGWFYHATEESTVKTPSQLMDLYYKSVGRNAVMLVNIPPDQNGLFPEKDVINLNKFKEMLDETFSENYVLNAKVTTSDCYNKSAEFNPGNIVDNNSETYWAAADGKRMATVEIELDSTKRFDRIMLQEPIRFGQRISSFDIQILNKNVWHTIAAGTTIGYKRLLRIAPSNGSKIRINIREANNPPALSNLGVYLASKKEAIF